MGITSTSMSSKDIETVEKLIMKPRCGELDIHTKPYKLLKKIGSWYTFSYTIKSWSPNISRELQNETIWRSIKKWQEKLPLKATWVDDDSDVEVHFVQGVQMFVCQSNVLLSLKFSKFTCIYMYLLATGNVI